MKTAQMGSQVIHIHFDVCEKETGRTTVSNIDRKSREVKGGEGEGGGHIRNSSLI